MYKNVNVCDREYVPSLTKLRKIKIISTMRWFPGLPILWHTFGYDCGSLFSVFLYISKPGSDRHLELFLVCLFFWATYITTQSWHLSAWIPLINHFTYRVLYRVLKHSHSDIFDLLFPSQHSTLLHPFSPSADFVCLLCFRYILK